MMPTENGHVCVEANKEITINDSNNNGGRGDKEEEQELSVPRGGPIFVGNFVGPITSISYFKKNIVEEVQGLEDELADLDLEEEDISVDDLKILTDEELVEMAIKEAFEDDNKDAPSADIVCEKKKSNKRKRNKGRQNEDSNYMAKVENVRLIKVKQDEEKTGVTLHSFNPNDTGNFTWSKSTIDNRMKLLRSANSAIKIKSSSISQEYMPVHYPEVALSIEVYHNKRKWVKNQEFLVLGQQTLTELRDRIYCLTDHVMRKAGQHDPSGYFLIEDTFCNDLRDQSAVDYSEPILDWLEISRDDALKKWECIETGGELSKKKKEVLGNATGGSELPIFRALDMHKTRFSDLKFKLGAGYLYCHQGDCRHTIVIRDMRLIHAEDMQNRAAYPILLFQVKPVVRKCNVCRIFRATKVTVDDKWAQDNPCYFCDDCYYLLHYKDGCLVYDDFSVYDYQHD